MVLDLKALTAPVGVVRVLEVVFTGVSFCLVASVGHSTHPFWTWCMTAWCLCFCVTLLILVLELAALKEKLLFSWVDFTAAFAMFATLMVLAASIIYPIYFVCSVCSRQIAASVTSILAFLLYATEVGMIRAGSAGATTGFLTTVPGPLKVLEVFVACVIFMCVDYSFYYLHAGLQWCVAVYSICFFFTTLFIVLAICRTVSFSPMPRDHVVLNAFAVLMYATAAVVWPLYTLKNNPRPAVCSGFLFCHPWDNFVVIAFMTAFNLLAYIVDTVHSFKLLWV